MTRIENGHLIITIENMGSKEYQERYADSLIQLLKMRDPQVSGMNTEEYFVLDLIQALVAFDCGSEKKS